MKLLLNKLKILSIALYLLMLSISPVLAITAQAQDAENPPLGPGDFDEKEYENSVFYDICQFRRIFCGNAGMALVGAGVFAVGMAMFVGRAQWTTVVVFSVGAVVFISADMVARQIITPPIGSPVMAMCSCLMEIGDLEN